MTEARMMATTVEVWKDQLLRGAAIWSARGRHAVEDGRCVALSGVAGTNGNIIFCLGSGLPGSVRRSAEEVQRSPVPMVVMIGGEALGWAQILVDSGLVCIGATPFMHLPAGRIDRGVSDPAVRTLRREDLDDARAVVAAAYADSAMADIAIPAEGIGSEEWGMWGLEVGGRLVSVVTTSTVGDATSIWSMSTVPSLQGRGYGLRLLRVVLSEVADAGANHVLLYASASGQRLYREVGFAVVEYWQGWSRARWVPGQT